jgi:AraC-like DNA-binding protein
LATIAVRLFAEPDQFAAAIRPAHAQCTITRRGKYSAELTLVDLENVALRRFETSIAQTSFAALSTENVVFAFLLSDTENTSVGGLEMRRGTVIQYGVGHEYFTRSLGPRTIGHVLLPHAALRHVVGNAGTTLNAWKVTHRLTPTPLAHDRIVGLQNDVARLARDAPEVLARPGAAHGVEQALIEAMSDCLADIEPVTVTVTQRHREAVVRRFRELVEEDPSASLFMPEVCAEIGVSARIFRRYCQEQMGVSPKRFLLLRRLHGVRRKLVAARPDETTVTDVATQFGFWELGRFAVVYKSLFNESPSMTLRRRTT